MEYKHLGEKDSIPYSCPKCEKNIWMTYARIPELIVFVYCRNTECRWGELYKVVKKKEKKVREFGSKKAVRAFGKPKIRAYKGKT